MDKRYTVAQTCDIVGVKSYVLRYWEDELSLRIGRNELGHRYYTGYDIQMFLNIKELKNRGLQLRAIRELIPKIARTAPGSTENKIRLLHGPQQEEELYREETMEYTETPDIHEEVTEEKIVEFQHILERLIAQEIHFKREGEDRCRSLDAAIRRQQLARKEAAAASDKKAGKKHRLHK